MASKIKKDGKKKYYGKYDVTPPVENEDYGFSTYQPYSEGGTNIEDIYSFIKSSRNMGGAKDKDKYAEVKKYLLDEVDKEINKAYGVISLEQERLNKYLQEQKEKIKNDPYAKYLSTSTQAENKVVKNHKRIIDDYNKKIRKFVAIYEDLEKMDNISPDDISTIFDRYIAPNKPIEPINTDEGKPSVEVKKEENDGTLPEPDGYLKSPSAVETPGLKENIKTQIKSGEIYINTEALKNKVKKNEDKRKYIKPYSIPSPGAPRG